MNRFRGFIMFAMVAIAIAVKFLVAPPANAVLVDTVDEVAFVMSQEGINLAVIAVDVEATSTAEIVFVAVRDIEQMTQSDSSTAVSVSNVPQDRWRNFTDLIATGLKENYIGADLFQTDNMLRSGAAFVGGGLPYRAV